MNQENQLQQPTRQKTCSNPACLKAGLLRPIEEFKRPGRDGGLEIFGKCNDCDLNEKQTLAGEIERLSQRLRGKPKRRQVWLVSYNAFKVG